MINVSSAFKAALNINPCKERARLITLDGTLFNLTQEDFSVKGNSFTDGAGASTLPVGAAISHTVSGSLINETGKFDGHDLYGAELTVWLSLELESGKTEEILMGTFRITSAKGDDVLTFSAQDDMYRADTEYTPPDGMPSLLTLYKDICTKCGLSSGITDFANSGYTPVGLTGGYTARQMLGYIAVMAGGNAYIDHNGLLRIRSYDPTETAADTLAGWKSFEPDTVDTTITGLCCTVSDTDGNTQKITSGAEGYMLTLTNPLFSGQEQTALDLIAAKLVGLTFRRFSGDHVAYPMLECMDVINATDRKGNQYKTIVTDVTFNWFGLTTIKNSATSSSEQGRTYTTPESAAVIASRKLVAAERTARETAIAQLNKQLSDTPGLYKTVEEDSAGGSIYYFSDKPTVKESSVVLKLTASALGISTDGGKTYSWGANFLTGDGVMNIIMAKGIDAEWVNVDDLVAFGATIGGFHLTDSALYSGVKDSPTNATRGVYLDSAGQLCVGDSKSYLRYYKDSSGQYRLEIAAASMTLSTGQSVEAALQDVSDKAQAAQKSVNAVEVGGTNLLEGSRTLQSFRVTGNLVNNAYHDLTAVETSTAWMGIYVDLPSVVSKWGLQAGDIVTHSVMVMTDFDADTVCHFTLYRAPGKNDFIRLGDYTLRPGKWQKISVTFAIPAGEMSTDVRIETDYYTENTGYSFGEKHMYFAAPKLERGNKATDWTPCPTETADYIVASGTSGIWTYIKYSSGIAVCYGRREQGGLNTNQSEGNIYTSGANTISAINYPFTFTSAPTETVSMMKGDADRKGWLVCSTTQNTTEKTATYEFARGNSNWQSAVISYVVCGRWK